MFKRLNELKNNGFFGRDVTIRKTMFDDCKGPKFEELLMLLSAAALLKVIRCGSDDRSIAKKLLNQPSFDHNLSAPLLIAYQGSFSYKLRNREDLERRWRKFGRLLVSKHQDLDQRADEIQACDNAYRLQETSTVAAKKLPKRTLERLEKHLRQNWKGDTQWVDIILRSDQHRPQKTLLQRPFAEVWNYACRDSLYAIRPQRNDSLLQSLETRAEEQRARLDQWRTISDHLLTRIKDSKSNEHTELTENVPPSNHHTDASKQETVKDVAIPGFGEARNCTTAQPRVGFERVPGCSHQRKQFRSQSEAGQTPLSVRRHDNHIERPLANTSARLATPVQGLKSFADFSAKADQNLPSPGLPTPIASNFPSEIEARTNDLGRCLASGIGEVSECIEAQALGGNRCKADDIVSSVLNAPPTIMKPLSSLAERTRMSLASMTPTKLEPQLPAKNEQISRPAPPRFNSFECAPETPASSYKNLAERTRQSLSAMALSENPAENRRISKARLSSIYPVNQFHTPVKESAELSPAGTPAFEEADLNADYETIFKSRPRVAMSPMLKPMNEIRESFGSAVEKGNEASDEDDFS